MPFATVFALCTLVACTDVENPPITAPPSVFDVASVQVQDVRAVDIDLPPEVRPWDTSTVALEAAIAAEDGYASVAFKARNSARALTTGRREAVSKTYIEEGIRLLTGQGVEVLKYWAFMGAVFARLPGAC
jgi:hypothetical protein